MLTQNLTRKQTVEMLSKFGVDVSRAELGTRDHNLEGQLVAQSDALEEWEEMVQIRLMVVEAVWRGIVRAVEDEASKAVEVGQAELLKVKQEMQGKDTVISELIQAVKTKDDELSKLEATSHHKLQGEAKEMKDVNCLEGKDSSLGLLQGEVKLLNYKIQDVTSALSILRQEIRNYERGAEDRHNQIAKQESILRDTERLCQVLLVVAKHLQDKISVLNSKLLEKQTAAQLAHDEVQEQNWKHEAEITVIMTALEGRVMDLGTELSHFRSSKASLESRLVEAQAAGSLLETGMRAEQQKFADKANELKDAECRIALLEHMLVENDILLRNLQSELAQMKNSEIRLKERQKVVEQLLKEEQEKTVYLEHEHETKQADLETTVESLNEKGWLIDTEKMIISSYIETAFHDFQSITGEIMSASNVKGRPLETLYKTDQPHIHRPGINETVSSLPGKEIQQNITSSVQEFSKAQSGSVYSIPELEELKGNVIEENSQFEIIKKELGYQLSKKEEVITKLQEDFEERSWQSQVENLLILGYAEGLSQHMMEVRVQLEKGTLDAQNEVEYKCRCVAELEKEVSQLKNQIVLLDGELSSANRQMKVGFVGQLQTLTTSMQRLELDLAGKVEQFDSRLQQAHDTLKQMKKGFEGRAGSVMASVQRFEGNVIGRLEQFEARLQHIHYTLKQLSHMLRVRETQFLQIVQDFRKAETEVDYLGDEVDVLMDMLEKVYAVFNHYHHVIQLYPGLAEISNLVRQEVRQRFCDYGV